MSAFVVTDIHIQELVRFLHNYDSGSIRDFGLDHVAALSAVGQVLVDANYASVNYRYSGTDKPYHFIAKPSATAVISGVQAMKACDCLEYQSCEVPDWEGSEAAKLLNRIRKLAGSTLPGYEQAKWCLY